MPRVAFTTHLERYVSCLPARVEGNTVREVFEAAFLENPQLGGYVVDETGALRKHVSVFVDGTPITDRIRLSDSVSPDSEVYVLQALSGG